MRATTRILTTLIAAAPLALIAGPAQSAPPGTRASFVVNTQFRQGPSPIVAATGPFTSCTSVIDRNGAGQQTGPRSILFTGEKQLLCGDFEVIVVYQATVNQASGRKTFGTWSVVSSTLPGVEFGGGRLTGDAARCELLAGSDGCILDTFTGQVFS